MSTAAGDSVLTLCEAGVEDESAGDLDAARAKYRRALEVADTPYGKCLASHHLARLEVDPGDRLPLLLQSLDHACAGAEDPEVLALSPTIYLDLAGTHAELSHDERAIECYAAAADVVNQLERAYSVQVSDLLRTTICTGLSSLGVALPGYSPELTMLVERLTAAQAWRALDPNIKTAYVTILHAYATHDGTDRGGARLIETLTYAFQHNLFGAPAFSAERDLFMAAYRSAIAQANGQLQSGSGDSTAAVLDGVPDQDGATDSGPGPDVGFRI